MSKSRLISAVIFLNGTSTEPRDGMYGGGALTFYGLLDDPIGGSLGFPLEAGEGLLIAFRADVPHSVAAGTPRDRDTIAGWYVWRSGRNIPRPKPTSFIPNPPYP